MRFHLKIFNVFSEFSMNRHTKLSPPLQIALLLLLETFNTMLMLPEIFYVCGNPEGIENEKQILSKRGQSAKEKHKPELHKN